MTSSPARGLPGSNALDKKRDERGREVQIYDPESAVLHVREVDVAGGGRRLGTDGVCAHATRRCGLKGRDRLPQVGPKLELLMVLAVYVQVVLPGCHQHALVMGKSETGAC